MTAGTRKVETKEFGGLRATVTQLAPTLALSLLPDILTITGSTVAGLRGIQGLSKGDGFSMDDVVALGPTIMSLGETLGGGRLMRIAPQLMSTAIVLAPDESGKGVKKFEPPWDLDKLDEAFSNHVAKLPVVVRWAMGVTFADFLSEIAPFVRGTPAPSV